MNDALCRGAWDKGCTDMMYMTIEYPNYPIISLLTQPRGNCVNMLWLRNFPLWDLNLYSYHCNSMCYHWATTPLIIIVNTPLWQVSWWSGGGVCQQTKQFITTGDGWFFKKYLARKLSTTLLYVIFVTFTQKCLIYTIICCLNTYAKSVNFIIIWK